MHRNFRKQSFRLTLILLVSVVAGCQLIKKQDQPVQVEDVSLNSLEQQNLQINRAIHLLEQGKYSDATLLIEEVLKLNPQHSTAVLLNKQLTLPSETLFNTKRLAKYEIRSGDTLGQIAQEWLGNSLYFVSLAKLNHIKTPLNLSVGTLIEIPITATSEVVRKEKQRSTANIGLLSQYLKQKNYYEGLTKANSLFIVEADMAALLAVNEQLLQALAKSSVSLSERETMIAEAQKLAESSRNAAQQSMYEDFIRTQQKQLLLDESTLLFKDLSYLESAEKLVKAKRIYPAESLSPEFAEMQLEMLDRLHEQAVVFYRNHSLQDAMDRWNLVLQLQPNNELAKKYTQRTQKLLKKLNQY